MASWIKAMTSSSWSMLTDEQSHGYAYSDPLEQQEQQRWLSSPVTDVSQGASDSGVAEEESAGTFSAVVSNIFLFFLIFGMSATVDVKHMKHQLKNKFALGCGILMQFIIMPALGFLAVMATRNHGLTKPIGVSLLVLTSSPGGSYSNWWCSLFNADLALSVAMTTVSSILSIALLPANLTIYSFLAYGVADGNSIVAALDFGTLFISLSVVITAIVSGLWTGYIYDSPNFHRMANHFGSVCGILLISFSVYLSSGSGGESDITFWNMPWTFYVAVALPCLGGLLLSSILSQVVRLSRPETISIAVECCYQNTGIATSVAVTMYSNPDDRAAAVAVPLFYGVIEAVAVGVYCFSAWKLGWTKAPADEKLCVVLARSYEVTSYDDDLGLVSSHDQDPEQVLHSQPGAAVPGRVDNASGGSHHSAPVSEVAYPTTLLHNANPPLSWWRRLFYTATAPQQHHHHHPDHSDKTANVEGVVKQLAKMDDGKAGGHDNDDSNGVVDVERNRFISVDYTAETSQCSVPQSPDTPFKAINPQTTNTNMLGDVMCDLHQQHNNNNDDHPDSGTPATLDLSKYSTSSLRYVQEQ